MGIILCAVAGAAKGKSYVTTIAILGGIIAVGVLLILIAILGLVAVRMNKRGLIFAVRCELRFLKYHLMVYV